MNADDDKLLCDAVLYVLGDMPVSEREAFEQRLIDDQSAREAVAEAVHLCQVAYGAVRELARESIPVQPAAHVDHVWRRVAIWTAMTLAASIMFALVTGIGRDQRLPDGNRGEIASSDNQRNGDREGLLAVAWLNSALLDDVVLEESDDVEGSDSLNGESLDADDVVDEEELAMADPNANTSALEADWFFEAINSPPADAAEPTTSSPQEG